MNEGCDHACQVHPLHEDDAVYVKVYNNELEQLASLDRQFQYMDEWHRRRALKFLQDKYGDEELYV